MKPVLALLLVAAGAGANAAPRAPVGNEAIGALQRDCLASVRPTVDADQPAAHRNRLIAAAMVAIDIRYSEFTSRLARAGGRRPELASLVAALGPGGALDAGRLSRSDGGGRRSRRELRSYRESLTAALTRIVMTQMNIHRLAARTVIFERLRQPYEAWSSCMAFSDLVNYARAGSIDPAVSAVVQRAEAAARDAEAAAIAAEAEAVGRVRPETP